MSELKASISLSLNDRLSQPLQRTRAAIASVQQQAGKVESFQKMLAATRASKLAIQQQQAEVGRLARELKAAEKPSKALQRQFDSAVKKSQKAKQAFQAQTDQLSRLRTELNGAGIDTRKLGAEKRRLASEVDALNRKLSQQRRTRSASMRTAQSTMDIPRMGLRQQMSADISIGGIGVGALAMSRGVLGLARGAGIAGAAIAAAGYSAYRSVKPFIDTAAQFERYGVMLESIEGSTAKAKKAMDWVNDFATRTPLALEDVMGSFVKLRTFGIDPMNGTMQSLVDMNARMGGSAENLEGMVLAVGQAWTKGKLQGEEALQLIERGVPVWDLLAKRSGKSAMELQKMASSGELGRSAIQALVEEMGKLSAGSSDKQMKTMDGMISNMGDQWTRFKKMVMDSGPFDRIKTILGGWLEKIDQMAKSGELKEWADKVADGMLKTIRFLEIAYNLGRGFFTVLGWISDAGDWIRDKLLAPFQWLFDIISKLLTVTIEWIDKMTGAGISNWLGRSVSMLMAGLGDQDAAFALENENNLKYGPMAPTMTGNPARRNQANGQPQNGVLKIEVGDDRIRVRQLQSTGFDMDVTGMNMMPGMM